MHLFLKIIKTILHVFSSFFLFVFLIVFIVLSPLVGRLASDDGVTNWLSDSNLYTNVYDNLPEIIELMASSENEDESSEPIEFNEDILKILKGNLTPALVQEKVESVATNFYDQLEISEGPLFVRADLREVADILVTTIRTDFADYLDNLPDCKNNEDVDLDDDDFNPFAITCLPVDANRSEINEFTTELADMIEDKEDGFGEVLANVEEEIDTDVSATIRDAYRGVKLFDFYAIFMVMLLVVITVFTAKNWLPGLRRVSWLFIAIALPILVGSYLFSNIDVVEISPVFDETTTLTAAEQAVSENVLKPFATTVVKSLTGKMMLISGIMLAMGIITLVGTRTIHRDLHPKPKHPAEPDHSKHPGAHKEPAEKLEDEKHLAEPGEAKPNLHKPKTAKKK